MRREVASVAFATCLVGCSEWRLKPTFPEHAAGKPGLHEHATLGISHEGNAVVAPVVTARGDGPPLSPLLLRRAESHPAALILLLSEQPAGGSGEEVELARATLVGTPVAPQLFLQNGVAWVLAGSVLEGEPLHRALGVRRGSIARGEAQLHNNHGPAPYSPRGLDASPLGIPRALPAD